MVDRRGCAGRNLGTRSGTPNGRSLAAEGESHTGASDSKGPEKTECTSDGRNVGVDKLVLRHEGSTSEGESKDL